MTSRIPSAALALLTGFLLCFCPVNAAEDGAQSIAKAMEGYRGAEARAAEDPARPQFHFLAPSQWMNDPNGPIFYKGWYHMFYQSNPYGDDWGNMHWGHARSRDMVNWEHLPVALWPSKELGEEHVFSGCAVVNGRGEPMIFYTSIAKGKSAGDHAEQWAAIGSDDLLTWRKHPGNPILSEALHGDKKIYDWRDPYIFQKGGRTYLVAGGNLNKAKGGEGVVNLYQAENLDLTAWKYRGVMFHHSDPTAVNIECPNFFDLGKAWMLVISPHRRVEYFLGSLDINKGAFDSRRSGLLDFGNAFYAPNSFRAPDGKMICWGWVRGFKPGKGWNGCLTMPRVLSLDAEGGLRQEPITQLTKLRTLPGRVAKDVYVSNGTALVADFPGRQGELELVVEPGQTTRCGLRIGTDTDHQGGTTLSYDGRELNFGGEKTEFVLKPSEKRLEFRVFVDRSVIEVFINGRAACTKVLPLEENKTGIVLFAEGGSVHMRKSTAWDLKPIWQAPAN